MINKFIFLFILAFCTSTSKISTGSKLYDSYVSTHSPYGLPENMIMGKEDFVIFRKQYIVFYNEELNITNFVLYNLNRSWYGDVPRYSGSFIYDTLLDKLNLKEKITHSDYTNTSFDRGHLVRSEERSKTIEDNKSTFYTSNIIPQRHDLNAGVWYSLETFCEDLCKVNNKNLIIIAGGIYSSKTKVNELTIPDEVFKIVLVLNEKTKYKDVTDFDYMFAVRIPNVVSMRKRRWIDYTCSVDELESILKYDFFPSMKKNVQDKLEKVVHK